MRTFYLSSLVAVCAAVASSSPAQEASPGTGGDVILGSVREAPFSDPGDMMAESLAHLENISLDEARRILVLQHDANTLASRLRATYGQKLAGTMVENTPAFRAHYYFAGVDLAEVQRVLSSFRPSPELLPLIRLERAEQTEAEMQATAQGMRQQLQDLGIPGSIGLSVPLGGYKILTTDVAKAEEAVRRGQITGGRILGVEYFGGIIVGKGRSEGASTP